MVDGEDAVAAFEDALARHDTDAAKGLVDVQPDPSAAFLRIWNIIAMGEDSTEAFTLDRLRNVSQRAAEKVRDAIVGEHLGRRTCENIGRYMRDPAIGAGRVDGRDLPWLAYHLVTSKCLTLQEDHRVIARAWTSAEYPERSIGTDAWHVIFAVAEGVVTDVDTDGQGAPVVPTESLRLYRGSLVERAAGMAWTGDKDRAAWFAQRWNGQLGDIAHVWTALVEPERILARFVLRSEDEYVIDTTDLNIDRVD